jgi:hypothetical protein
MGLTIAQLFSLSLTVVSLSLLVLVFATGSRKGKKASSR